MNELEIDSTEMDTEYDIIDEMTETLEEMEESYISGQKDLPDKISYMRFLLGELGYALSGKYEKLRRVRFITKKTP
ncbi:MAG: hypothetical protein JW882_14075 [Deltaproteobacteria bacterium]|nr:hypothetical protein [Deltaproteobacteria bacterium]